MPFAEFKKIYEKTYYFNSLNENEKELELENAYKVATDGNIKPSIKKRKESEPVISGERDFPNNEDIRADNDEKQQEPAI